jgi:5-methylthioadenosine/S-adenosylhomocysteine deaminase
MATLGGARAMGLGGEIGSLVPGKRADLVTVRFDVIEAQPFYNAISQIVYASGRQQVRDVWIDGVAKLRDGALVDLDEAALIAKAGEWRARIAGLPRG